MTGLPGSDITCRSFVPLTAKTQRQYCLPEFVVGCPSLSDAVSSTQSRRPSHRTAIDNIGCPSLAASASASVDWTSRIRIRLPEPCRASLVDPTTALRWTVLVARDSSPQHLRTKSATACLSENQISGASLEAARAPQPRRRSDGTAQLRTLGARAASTPPRRASRWTARTHTGCPR